MRAYIKQRLGLRDEETVEQIREYAYLQFFLIYRVFEQYTRCPPADITYPTDLKLLNEAKESTEKTNKNFIEKRSGLGAHRPCCEVDAFYWTDMAPDIVNPGREEQGSFSV
jgi:hypothetical protein